MEQDVAVGQQADVVGRVAAVVSESSTARGRDGPRGELTWHAQ